MGESIGLPTQVSETPLSYRNKQLSDLPVLEVPTDRPRSAVESHRYAKRYFVFSGTLRDRLEDLSREEGLGVSTILLAAYQTLLFLYTGQDVIAVGSPTRRMPGQAEGLTGSFAGMLAFRSDLSGNPAFRTLLARVRTVVADAYEHHDMRHQVMFEHQKTRGQTLQPLALPVARGDVNGRSESFDLFLSTWEDVDGLKGELEYSSDLFDAETIERMIDHFKTLLQGIVTNPDQQISSLPILTEPEKHQLLAEWNDTQRPYAKDKRIHELFEAQVELSPDATAVSFEDKQLSYRELNSKANQLARHLQKLGVGPETVVGLCVERSPEMILGMLGVLKAGGAYLPLDPALPKERLAFKLQDAQVPILLSQQRLLAMLPTSHCSQVLCLDTDWKEIASQSDTNPDSSATSENLAYLIYTSGSTGKPKGVQIEHRAVINFFSSMQQELELTAKDRLLAVTTLSFDMAQMECLFPLSVGATVEVVSRTTAADGNLLARKLSDPRITVMQATPAAWRLLLEAGWPGSRHLKIISGGEDLPKELATKLLARVSSLWNMYGPTETTIYSATYKVRSGVGPVPIGRPIGNTQVYILDRHLHLLPVGVPGELYIGGVGLARGYLKRPDLTGERFISHVLAHEPGARLYKTGDLARYLPDGNIEYLGRIDHQVKIRGFRIETGEIETVLSQYPGVQQTVVSAFQDNAGEKRLVAYVISKPNQPLAVTALKSFLSTKLPDYMMPSAFMFLEKLPMTPNGKVDRRALPVPNSTRTEFEKSFVAPRDHLELQLTNIWEQVLDVRPVGVRDSFVDLGGYSLLALRVMTEIERTLGKKLPLSSLSQAHTIEQLALLLSQEGPFVATSSLVPLQRYGLNPPFFWIHGERSDPVLPLYLGPEQPLYGIGHQAQDGTPALYTTVEDMAAHYVGEIRSVQTRGPYSLGGYCFGGIVAFEMAHQLTKQGEAVALLAMLDPDTPQNYQNREALLRSSSNSRSFFRNITISRGDLRRHWHNIKLLPPWAGMKYVLMRLKERVIALFFLNKMRNVAKRAACKVYLGLGYPLPPSLRSSYILGVYGRALERYTPTPYSGRLVVFETSSQSHTLQTWKTLSGRGLEIHEVPGSHTEVLKEPNVGTWAEKLKSCLQEQPIV